MVLFIWLVSISQIAFFITSNGDSFTVHNVSLFTVARFGFAPGRNMCVSDTGTVEFLDNKPAKMFLKYRNKKTGQTHEQNQWVLYTDYKNLAIMYACEDKLQLDGLCESKHRYIWILAKKTTLTEAEDQKAKAMAASVCITETLKSIDHKHPCNQQITM